MYCITWRVLLKVTEVYTCKNKHTIFYKSIPFSRGGSPSYNILNYIKYPSPLVSFCSLVNCHKLCEWKLPPVMSPQSGSSVSRGLAGWALSKVSAAEHFTGGWGKLLPPGSFRLFLNSDPASHRWGSYFFTWESFSAPIGLSLGTGDPLPTIFTDSIGPPNSSYALSLSELLFCQE